MKIDVPFKRVVLGTGSYVDEDGHKRHPRSPKHFYRIETVPIEFDAVPGEYVVFKPNADAPRSLKEYAEVGYYFDVENALFYEPLREGTLQAIERMDVTVVFGNRQSNPYYENVVAHVNDVTDLVIVDELEADKERIVGILQRMASNVRSDGVTLSQKYFPILRVDADGKYPVIFSLANQARAIVKHINAFKQKGYTIDYLENSFTKKFGVSYHTLFDNPYLSNDRFNFKVDLNQIVDDAVVYAMTSVNGVRPNVVEVENFLHSRIESAIKSDFNPSFGV